ncbi:prephenate dehydratase [Baekduia alba]|uniref:prephenate dehydratase n=1 Tax=Baekduia alba TaxID=2997333 RepID=UPI00233FC3F7|nr:prephenate dehydratase [Baekduia alba]
MRLGCLGPAGTFTHAALSASWRSAGAKVVPLATERDTVLAAERGDVDAALVPIENSLEGGVNASLDTLAFDAPGVSIVGEEVLPVTHALIAREGVAVGAVDAVVSHPQPLGQCRRWLADNLPGRRAIAATSTAEAVRIVSESDEPWAAIGTVTAAGLYGCAVLAEGIEDEHGNETRFLWVAATGRDPFAGAVPAADVRLGAPKTSIAFHGAGDASPGWLVRCLSELAFRGINLTRIESRPLKRQLGHYLFFVDLEGDAADPNVAEAIERVHVHAEVVRVLGSYPRAVR